MDDFDNEFLDEDAPPAQTIAELLPEIAEVAATLSRIVPVLQEWEDWYEDDEGDGAKVIEQAYGLLAEAETSIHASAAILHLFMTGMNPPSELLEEVVEELELE